MLASPASPASPVASLVPRALALLLQAPQWAEPRRLLCEVNSNATERVMPMARYRAVRYDGSFSLVDAARKKKPPRLAARVRRLTDGVMTVPGYTVLAAPRTWLRDCDVVAAAMDAPEPRMRQSLVLDLSRLIGASAVDRPALLVLHGQARCDAATYASTGIRLHRNVSCWAQAWAELARRRDLVGVRCEVVYGRRWCWGTVNQRSLCTVTRPLLGRACAERVSFGSAWASHGVRIAYRYYTVLRCDDGPPAGAAGLGSSRSRVCLLFKDQLRESYVAGFASEDGLRFEGDPELAIPTQYKAAMRARAMRRGSQHAFGLPSRSASLTHNYAMLRMPNGNSSAPTAFAQRRPTAPPPPGPVPAQVPTCWSAGSTSGPPCTTTAYGWPAARRGAGARTRRGARP